MPRKRRTQGGAPAQNIGSVPGQRYGEGVAQQAMQRELPAPDNRSAAPTTGAPAPVAAEPGGQMSLEDVLGAAGGVQGAGMLAGGTSRPNEPLTTGLPIGPGAGPEVLGGAAAETPGGRFLRDLAMRTGNRYFAELAERAGQ